MFALNYHTGVSNLVVSQLINTPVLSYVYSKQPVFGLTQEWLREAWSLRQGTCLFTPCVGSVTSPGIDTK